MSKNHWQVINRRQRASSKSGHSNVSLKEVLEINKDFTGHEGHREMLHIMVLPSHPPQ